MDDAQIDAAVRVLRAGGVVALPTETVYGLATDAANDDAVRRIFAIKGRPADHPLILHVADVAEITRYARDVPRSVPVLAQRFWPGPLTVILHKSDAVSNLITGGQATVALRVPDHPLMLAILRGFGGALAAPSANRYGRVSPTNAAHVRDDLGDAVDLIVDGGPSRVGVESTILDLTGAVPAILRVGAIGASALGDALGTPVLTRIGGEVRASGTHASHYAPRARLVLSEDADAEAKRRSALGERVGVLTLPSDPHIAAHTLYSALRALDAENDDTIVTELPPDDEANAAVRDRLTRAAAPRNSL